MSGICRFYRFVSINMLKRMVKSLHIEVWMTVDFIYTTDNVSLGPTRLSIIDLSEKGRQPMSKIDFIKKLRGMFAFTLYDSEKKKLILARDPIGKKPLYHYWAGERFIFASEIKAILETGIRRKIDLKGLCTYLAHQYTIGRSTMFKGTKKLLKVKLLVIQTSNERG